jgi:hypothetical protein
MSAAPWRKFVKALREGAGAGGRFDGVAQRHLLEREQKIGARLDRDRMRGDRAMLARRQHGAEGGAVEHGLPAGMRGPFVAALPIQIGWIVKALGKIVQELGAAAPRLRREFWLGGRARTGSACTGDRRLGGGTRRLGFRAGLGHPG